MPTAGCRLQRDPRVRESPGTRLPCAPRNGERMQSMPPVAGAQWEVAPPGASLHSAHWVPAGQSLQPFQAAPRQGTSPSVDSGGASSNFYTLLRRYEEETGTGWHYLLVRLEPPLGATDHTRTHLHHPPRILELALVGHGAARPAAAAGDRAGNCTGKSRTKRSTGRGPQRALHTRSRGPQGRTEPFARPHP